MMHYNESCTPKYSRNPLKECQQLIFSETGSKKNSIPHSQSFQMSRKYLNSMSRSRQVNSLFQNSQHVKKEQINPNQANEKELNKKEKKILKLRKQINQDNDEKQQKTPKDDRESQRNSKHPKLTIKQSAKLQTQPPEQTLFSPKILNRSKSLSRKLDVSTLLYEDARRRQEKEQFMFESQRKQRDLMSPKINSNTNVLVLKKIYQEFNELVTEQQINPLIALSILQELFNVNLNPHKQSPNHQAIQRLITILQGDNGYGQIRKERVWNFVTLIILGQLHNSPFNRDQEKQIQENYQFFYKHRMTRERRGASPDQPTFRPKTLGSSTKLAHSFRQKACQKIDDFVQTQNVHLNLKNGTYTIQDLYIIDHHKKMAQNQQKRIQKEQKELQECTFKPDISPSKQTANITKNKPKIALKTNKTQQLKTQYTYSSNNPSQKSTLSGSKVNGIRSRCERQRFRKEKEDKENSLSHNVKDVEKVILRMSVGRQKREFSNKVQERGYPKDQNWDCYQRSMHRQAIDNHKKLKGYRNN